MLSWHRHRMLSYYHPLLCLRFYLSKLYIHTFIIEYYVCSTDIYFIWYSSSRVNSLFTYQMQFIQTNVYTTLSFIVYSFVFLLCASNMVISVHNIQIHTETNHRMDDDVRDQNERASSLCLFRTIFFSCSIQYKSVDCT